MKIASLYRTSLLAAAASGLALAFAASANENKLQRMDANKDGKISAPEHEAGARQMFQRMDADGDGRVTAAEMDASHGAMSGGSGSARMSSVEKIEVIDTDKDGVLTASEHASGSRERFAKMDGDGDGSLTPAELEAGHQKLMSDQPR